MAYEDPAHVRDNVIKVRLNDPTNDVVRSLARLNKRQPATFALDLILLGLQVLETQGSSDARAA